MEEKRCPKCGNTKSKLLFSKNRSTKDGLASLCKDCKSIIDKIYRENNGEKCLRLTKDWKKYNHERFRSVTREYWRKMWREKPDLMRHRARMYYHDNHEKVLPRRQLAYNVRKGRVVRGPCMVCGGNDHPEGHHYDYSKPLDVMWLCRRHHKELHKTKERLDSLQEGRVGTT